MHKIPCHNCNSTYIGKTRRAQKKVESISNRTLTQADQTDLAAKTNKSAITDNVAEENHISDWSDVKIPDRESHHKTRELMKSICIWKEINCINRDGGTYDLPMTYSCIFSRQCHVTICLMKSSILGIVFWYTGCVI